MLQRADGITHVLQICAGRIRVLQIEDGRDEALLHGTKRKDRLERPAGAERVSHVALVGGVGDAVAEDPRRGVGFRDVASVGGGAVAVDAVDVLGTDPRVLEREFHGAAHLFALRRRDVYAVGIFPEADHFGVDPGAAGLGVRETFQNERPRAFAHDEAVAVLVEGARRLLGRVVVAAGGRKERVEDRGVGGVELFGTPGDHHLLLSVTNRLIGHADPLRARGAGGARRDDAALEAEVDPNVDGRRVAHHAHVRRSRDAAAGLRENEVGEFRHGRGLPSGRAVGDAAVARREDGVAEKARVSERVVARLHGHEGDASHGAGALSRKEFRIERVGRDRSGDAGVEVRLVPVRHVANGAAVLIKGFAHGRPVVAQGREKAHAGDDDAFHQRPPETGMTLRVT